MGLMAEEAVCPECRAGKCRNCDGTAWDPVKDEPTQCTHVHPEVSGG